MSNAFINSTLQPDSKSKIALQTGFGRLPLSFEVNQGQTDAEVKFLSRGKGYTLFLTPKEAVLSLKRGQKLGSRMPDGKSVASLPKSKTHGSLAENSQSVKDVENPAVLRIKLIGANPQPDIVGREELPGKVNYFLGNDPKKWRTKISTFTKVKYKDVYPGIDLVYYGNQGQLEYDFIVAPGADPKIIKFAVQGADKLELNGRGDLVVNTSDREILQHKPVVYQQVDGNEHIVAGHYIFNEKHELGFEVAAYDLSKPLIIDPVLSYSTYFGGSGEEVARAIAVDGFGVAYITGSTAPPFFSPVPGPPGPPPSDIFVTKLTPDGAALIYTTYLGGGADDAAFGIAVDAAGAAYVTGTTFSPDFPTARALQPRLQGNADAFVAKLTPDGAALVYATYLGGNSGDGAAGIARSSDGAVHVVGGTNSPDFPTTQPLQPKLAGGDDAFVAKLTADGTALVYATYLGGSSADDAQAVAVDAAGAAYVSGFTSSTNFPTVSPLQAALHGDSDAFVAKLTVNGTALVYSTYLGGSGRELGNGIAVDSNGAAYVAGHTLFSADFPIVNPLQPTLSGSFDAFVAKFTPTGSALVYATYLGGSREEGANSIAVDAAGSAYVTGYTNSADFPVMNPLQRRLNGSVDAFVAKLMPNGTGLDYGTYLGGSSFVGGSTFDQGFGIAVDASGAAYVVGTTNSPDFPAVNALQPALVGEECGTGQLPTFCADAFAAKLIPSHIVNDLLTFIPIESTFNSSPNTSGCPSDFVGEFRFTATLTNNTSNTPVSNLVANVTTLSNGNLLQNADGGPGGVGNTLAVPRVGNFSDGVLSPGEFVDVPFSICLKNLESFDFFVDVHVLE